MSDTDLIGKHLMAWMAAEVAFRDVLGLPPHPGGQPEIVAIGGRVVGITSQLGVWIELNSILRWDLSQLIPGLPDQHRKQLLRWELIRSAVFQDDPPTPEQEKQFVGGFRPR